MAKGNKETEHGDVKFSSGKASDEGSEKNSVMDEEDETSSKGSHHSKDSGQDDLEEKSVRERGESIAIEIEDVDAPDGRTKKQANTYAAKKTVAQGMMDIALITANANQLRYIIEFNRNSSTFYVNVILIILSLCLQVGVGLSLIFKGGLDLRGQSKHRYAKRINNYVVVGVFLVTIINVFIASFTVTGGGPKDK